MLPLFLILFVMSMGASACIALPLLRNKQRAFALLITATLTTVTLGSYWLWFEPPALRNALYIKSHRAQIAKMANQLKDPSIIIARIKTQLAKNPEDAKGWYLLGKLYFSQGKFTEAANAFDKAKTYKPKRIDLQLNYAEALFYANKAHLTPKAQTALNKVIKLSPDHPMALNLFALDAYQRHAYKDAIHYWERLLLQLDPDSKEAEAVLRAIKKSRSYL